jgi:hypothetical protein
MLENGMDNPKKGAITKRDTAGELIPGGDP